MLVEFSGHNDPNKVRLIIRIQPRSIELTDVEKVF